MSNDTTSPDRPVEWAKYFDRIFCVHYLPQVGKWGRLVEELKRVGIWDSGLLTVRCTDDNAYDRVTFSWMNAARCPDAGCVNLGREVLSIMNEAHGNGWRRILVLENDVAFLKDLSAIAETLADIPYDADVIQFDKFVVPKGEERYREMARRDNVGRWFFDAKGDIYYSGACFGLSARGVDFVRKMEMTALCPPDSTFAYAHGRGLKRIVATRNMAVQVVYRGSVSEGLYGVNSHHDGYGRGGVDYSLYALPDGYGYGSAV